MRMRIMSRIRCAHAWTRDGLKWESLSKLVEYVDEDEE